MDGGIKSAIVLLSFWLAAAVWVKKINVDNEMPRLVKIFICYSPILNHYKLSIERIYGVVNYQLLKATPLKITAPLTFYSYLRKYDIILENTPTGQGNNEQNQIQFTW
jgi:hypothetical protein